MDKWFEDKYKNYGKPIRVNYDIEEENYYPPKRKSLWERLLNKFGFEWNKNG